MAQYICPCCGQSFNGKRCRSCYYETFDDEITRNLHTHQKVNVPDIPATRPAHVQREWEQQKREYRRKKEALRKKKAPKGFLWLLVILLLNPILSIAGLVIEEVADGISGISQVSREPEAPEPDAAIPEDSELLFSAGGFSLYIGTSADGLNYPLFLENTTSQNVRLDARHIILDGFRAEQSSAWCDAPAGTLREGIVCLDQEDLSWAGVDVPSHMEMTFVIYETDNYEDLLEETVTILDGEPKPALALAGEVLLETEDILISSLGYQPDNYRPELFYEGTMRFYIENRTGDLLSVYLEEALADGEETNLSLWCELPPETRTVSRMWLYDLEDLEIEENGQPDYLELHLMAYNGSETMDLGWITVYP